MHAVFVASGIILFALSWLIPSKFLPWVSFQNEALAFLAVSVIALAAVTALHKSSLKTVGFPAALAPLFGLAIVAVLQGMTGNIVFWGDVWMFLLYLALCAICLTLGFALARRDTAHGDRFGLAGTQTAVAVTLLCVAAVSAIIAVGEVLELWPDSTWIMRLTTLRRPGANLGQPNHLATLELMGLASLIFLHHTRKLSGFSAGSLFVILCVGLAATESRTGALAFLVGACWWFSKRKRVGFTVSPYLALLAILGFLLLFWAWPPFLRFVQMTDASMAVNTSAGLRMIVWPQLLEAVTMRPWWGWGIREVAKAHNAVADQYAVSESFSYSHNIVLDLVLGIGLPLTLLLLVPTGIWLWRRAKAANQASSWFCLAVALSLAVHAMLEFPFAYAYFLVPTMLLLGTLEGEMAVKPMVNVGKRFCTVFVVLFALTCGWTGYEYFGAEEDFRMARFENLRIGQTPADYERPKLVLLTQLGALRDSIRIRPEPGMSPEDIEIVRRVALHYPSGAPLSRYALVLALNGYPEEAIRQARVLRVLLGEGAYMRLKLRFAEVGENTYPQLLEVKLP